MRHAQLTAVPMGWGEGGVVVLFNRGACWGPIGCSSEIAKLSRGVHTVNDNACWGTVPSIVAHPLLTEELLKIATAGSQTVGSQTVGSTQLDSKKQDGTCTCGSTGDALTAGLATQTLCH